MAKSPKTPKGAAASALDEKGIEWVVEQIVNGGMLTDVARTVGVSLHGLTCWLAADEERSARAREARRMSAATYDEKAEDEIRSATDVFSLSKAKELAHHYRWKAAKLDPRRFGDKVQIGGDPDGAPVKTESSVTVTAEEAYKRMIGGQA